MKKAIALFLKGAAMGAANVIPGVSGGTIAFITGIYEDLINGIKSFDVKGAQLLLKFDFKGFANHVNLPFLVPVGAGVVMSILSLAKLLTFLLCSYELATMAFFFGLIIASIILVGKQVKSWNIVAVLMLLIGLAIAGGIGFMEPASANSNVFYLLVCGAIAACSMVLPGLSGSYVLLLMGNYILIMTAISDVNLRILGPVLVGAAGGIIGFSHLLSYIFKRFHDGTVALLTGFVAGSLFIIWPWKTTTFLQNGADFVDKKGNIIHDTCRDGVVMNYARFLPEINGSLILPLVLVVVGIAVVLLIERLGNDKKSA